MSIEHRELGSKRGYEEVLEEFLETLRKSRGEEERIVEISGESAHVVRKLLIDVISSLRQQEIIGVSEINLDPRRVIQIENLRGFIGKLTGAGGITRTEDIEFPRVSFGDTAQLSLDFLEVRNLGLSALQFLQNNARSMFLSEWTSSDFYRAYAEIDEAFVQQGGRSNLDLRKYFESQIQPRMEAGVA